MVDRDVEDQVYFMLFGAAIMLKQTHPEQDSNFIRANMVKLALRLGDVPVQIISQAMTDAEDVVRVDRILPKWEA